jgi:hypothetical protein
MAYLNENILPAYNRSFPHHLDDGPPPTRLILLTSKLCGGLRRRYFLDTQE